MSQSTEAWSLDLAVKPAEPMSQSANDSWMKALVSPRRMKAKNKGPVGSVAGFASSAGFSSTASALPALQCRTPRRRLQY